MNGEFLGICRLERRYVEGNVGETEGGRQSEEGSPLSRNGRSQTLPEGDKM